MAVSAQQSFDKNVFRIFAVPAGADHLAVDGILVWVASGRRNRGTPAGPRREA
jgi:hypothetical protein